MPDYKILVDDIKAGSSTFEIIRSVISNPKTVQEYQNKREL